MEESLNVSEGYAKRTTGKDYVGLVPVEGSIMRDVFDEMTVMQA